jgi:hypothetical protein
MFDTKFEVTRLGRRVDVTLDELESLHKFTNEQLEAYRSYVVQLVQQIQSTGRPFTNNTSILNFDWLPTSHEMQNLKQSGKSTVQCYTLNVSHNTPKEMCEALNVTIIEGVDKLLEYNNGFMCRARAGYIRKDKDRFFYLVDRFNPNNIQPLEIEYIVNSTPRATCEKCGHTVERNRLKAHQKTPGCAKAAHFKQIKDRGLVQSRAKEVIKLAEQGLIPAESVPVEWEWYVPTRINQSVEQYHKNNGYAGLTLEEYLLKLHGVAPEENIN